MSRIIPLEHEQTRGDARKAFDEGLAKWGRMTNMKRTLLHSLPSYEALMQWYPLFESVKGFTGERLAVVFAHAISSESDCLICTTFMRRLLIDWGESPDQLNLDEKGNALVAFGRAVAQPGSRVPEKVYNEIARFFNPDQIVALTAFAGLMLATNIINNALEVDLDGYLYEYREAKPLKEGQHGK
jgi:alkylhydroperoxidase family enzyme